MSKVAFLNRLLARRSMTLIPDWDLKDHVAAKHLAQLLTIHKIDCVLDVGANSGQFREFVVRSGWRGPVVSFEPVRRYFDTLKPERNWRVFNYALGSKREQLEITLYDSPGLASMKPAKLQAMRDLLPCREVNIEGRETIQIHRLDAVFDEVTANLAAHRVLLKIDTQGFDLEVFRGAAGVMDRVHAVQTELSFLPIYEDAPSYVETLTEMRGAGFEVSGIFPVTHDDALRAVEFDCLLVRGAP